MVEFLLKYNNIECWTLFVAIATFVVTCVALYYNYHSNKKRKKSELARKIALYKELDEPFSFFGLDHTVADRMRMEKNMLKVEIEQLMKEV